LFWIIESAASAVLEALPILFLGIALGEKAPHVNTSVETSHAQMDILIGLF
jgi:hypothetical protein